MSGLPELKSAIDDRINSLFLEPGPLADVAAYSLEGGKRVRPLLMLSLNRDLGSDWTALIDPGVAVELLHASSLIHDDLPGLDNDSVRRGRPATHVKFGEGAAILAGDLLIARAGELLSSHPCSLGPEIHAAFVRVCEGQYLDLQNSIDRVHVNTLKTGALFSACAVCAAKASAGTEDTISRARAFGLEFGLAFQAKNDCEDSSDKCGREYSSDKKNSRVTMTSLGEPDLKSHVNRVLACLSDLSSGKQLKHTHELILQTFS